MLSERKIIGRGAPKGVTEGNKKDMASHVVTPDKRSYREILLSIEERLEDMLRHKRRKPPIPTETPLPSSTEADVSAGDGEADVGAGGTSARLVTKDEGMHEEQMLGTPPIVAIVDPGSGEVEHSSEQGMHEEQRPDTPPMGNRNAAGKDHESDGPFEKSDGYVGLDAGGSHSQGGVSMAPVMTPAIVGPGSGEVEHSSEQVFRDCNWDTWSNPGTVAAILPNPVGPPIRLHPAG